MLLTKCLTISIRKCLLCSNAFLIDQSTKQLLHENEQIHQWFCLSHYREVRPFPCVFVCLIKFFRIVFSIQFYHFQIYFFKDDLLQGYVRGILEFFDEYISVLSCKLFFYFDIIEGHGENSSTETLKE